MIYLVLILTIPLQELNSDKFVIRERATAQIIEHSSLEEIESLLASDKLLTPEQKNRLKIAHSTIYYNKMNDIVKLIERNKRPKNFQPYEDFKTIYGDNDLTFNCFKEIFVEPKSRAMVLSFYNDEYKDKSFQVNSYIVKENYSLNWHELITLYMISKKCQNKPLQDKIRHFITYQNYGCDCQYCVYFYSIPEQYKKLIVSEDP